MPTKILDDKEMFDQLTAIGIIGYDRQNAIVGAAKRCAGLGLATGAGWAVLGAPAFAPGALAGFLSGFATGTLTCMGLNLAMREKLKEIARDL